MTLRFSNIMSGRSVLAVVMASIGLALTAETFIWLIGTHLKGMAWYGYIVAGPLFLLASYPLASSAYDRLRRVQLDVDDGGPPEPARVLVLTASPGGGVALGKHSIAAHHDPDRGLALEHLFVLHTTDEKGHHAFADLRAYAVGRGMAPQAIHEEPLPPEAVGQPGTIYDCLAAIYDRLPDLEAGDTGPIREDQVVLDYTGGTSSFSAAMALCGAQRGRRLQYVRARRLNDRGLPADPDDAEVVEVGLDFTVKKRPPRRPPV